MTNTHTEQRGCKMKFYQLYSYNAEWKHDTVITVYNRCMVAIYKGEVQYVMRDYGFDDIVWFGKDYVVI